VVLKTDTNGAVTTFQRADGAHWVSYQPLCYLLSFLNPTYKKHGVRLIAWCDRILWLTSGKLSQYLDLFCSENLVCETQRITRVILPQPVLITHRDLH